jgi:hypothetical protein
MQLNIFKKFILRTSLGCCWALVSLCALAQSQGYPSKSLRLVMPYPAGGSTDIIGRLVAERLGSSLGQLVIVDNRAGASAQIGTDIALKAPADGYTLLMASSTNAINQALKPQTRPDFLEQIQALALIGKAGQILVAHPSLPVRSIQSFIQLARSHDGQLSYSSSGTGSSGHLAMEAFAAVAGFHVLHVPYKGNAPALQDLLGGQVVCGFSNVVSVIPHIKQARLRALAVSSARRISLVSQVPALSELGFIDFDISAWFGIVMRLGVPTPVMARLGGEMEKILKNPMTNEKLIGLGINPSDIENSNEFSEFLIKDVKRWDQLIKKIHLNESR